MYTPLIHLDYQHINFKDETNKETCKKSTLALCTPDTAKAILSIAAELDKQGKKLVINSLFRTYHKQEQLHNANPGNATKPGNSPHHSGRAFDIQTDEELIGDLIEFRTLAKKFGVVPIYENVPISEAKEIWHFECRGSHQKIIDYYRKNGFENAKLAMNHSAMLAVGVPVVKYLDCQKEANIQASLIRLGYDPGPIDGIIGPRTRAALEQANIDTNLPVAYIEEILQKQLVKEFPEEYTIPNKKLFIYTHFQILL